MKPALTVGIIGAGNLAWNLAANLNKYHFSIEQAISRSEKSLKEFAEKFAIPGRSTELSEIHPDLDLVFICTGDHSIGEVATTLAPHIGPQTIFVHSSGSMSVEALRPLGENIGIIYPLQTFTKFNTVDFQEIPIFIEFNSRTEKLIQETAETLSPKVKYMDSAGRLKLHLGAVFACNYANLMWLIANEVLLDLPNTGMEAYDPLLRRTLENALKYSPHESMTGPARRRDEVTLEKHLKLLEDKSPELKDLYQVLAKEIQRRF